MKHTILSLVVGVTLFSCGQEPLDNNDLNPGISSRISYQAGKNDFGSEPDTLVSGADKGDVYLIEGIRFEEDILVLKVGYSGGCATHEFEVQGELSPVLTDPPKANIAIVHESNGDACEAWISEELRINLKELLGGDRLDLSIYNPSQQEMRYSFLIARHIPQGNFCELETRFEEAICGTGLYDNKWFKVTGEELFWLQPVTINFAVDDTILEPGSSYKVGFWNTVWGGDSTVTCMAYPGPSVMAEITCLEKID